MLGVRLIGPAQQIAMRGGDNRASMLLRIPDRHGVSQQFACI